MIGMTFAEARKCGCPHQTGGCIAFACMAWRWDEEPGRLRFHAYDGELSAALLEPERPESVPLDWVFFRGDEESRPGWLETQDAATFRRRGYCGLAGPLRPPHRAQDDALDSLRGIHGCLEAIATKG